MSRKFWRRLAGCIAIECCLTAGGVGLTSVSLMAGPRPEFRAGAGASAHARAVVLEDQKGFRAVFAEADFPVTRAISDFVSVQLVKIVGLDRAGIVISGSGPAMADPSEIVGAAAQALMGMLDAEVSYDGVISVRGTSGGCIATLYPVRLDGCREGAAVKGRIRAAFQMVDLTHGLQTREAPMRTFPVQAVAIGKTVTVLAIGGNPPPDLAAAGRIVVAHATDANAEAPPGLVSDAVAAVLRRIR